MTKLLEEAVQKLSHLPKGRRDELARMLIDVAAKDNASAAWVVASFIRQSIDVLTKWPYRGRATEKEDIRRLVVTNYPYVVYVNDHRVLILTVMHTAQDRER